MNRAHFFMRLEPARPAGDPQRGFAAELADPAWLVGRQWQMGEHQGENASSPLQVHLSVRRVPIEPLPSRAALDPREVPAEAIVEAGPDDWWTIGRRARLGIAARDAGLIPADQEDALRFAGLTGPYEALNGVAFDGRKVHGLLPVDPVFAEVPAATDDLWHTDTLAYTAAFPSGGTTLAVGGIDGGEHRRWGGHDGGDVDWWSVDAAAPLDLGGIASEPLERWPDRFRWPGAPASRWWQIENHRVDLGGVPPDRGHLATTMLLDLVCGHADDWFLVPVEARIGHVLDIESFTITDSFEELWPRPEAPWTDIIDWSLYQVAGLSVHQLPIWPVAAAPLIGEPQDDVTIGMDEDANLVWAVEERLDGRVTDRRRPDDAPIHVQDDETAPVPAAVYHYTPTTAVPDHWYPYTREERDGVTRFVQGRLVSMSRDGEPTRNDPPTSRLLTAAIGPVHDIAPWRLPPTGLRLETRAILARTTTGDPILWVQRRRLPLLAVPSSGLRFDALTPADE